MTQTGANMIINSIDVRIAEIRQHRSRLAKEEFQLSMRRSELENLEKENQKLKRRKALIGALLTKNE